MFIGYTQNCEYMVSQYLPYIRIFDKIVIFILYHNTHYWKVYPISAVLNIFIFEYIEVPQSQN